MVVTGLARIRFHEANRAADGSYGIAGSFKIGGATRFHSDLSGTEVEV
jgi:hypothetical protein